LISARVIKGTDAKGDVLVRIGETVLRLKARGRPLAPESNITLAIRPEKSEIIADSQSKASQHATLSGKIIEHLFHGDKLRTRIDLGLGTPFLVDTQLGSAAVQERLLATGSKCKVCIDEPSIVAFLGDAAS